MSPGPQMWATSAPSRPDATDWRPASLNDGGACLRAGMVIVDCRSGNADGPDDRSILQLDRHPPGKRDQPLVGDLDHVQRLARLGELADLPRRHVEVPR